MTIDMTIGTAIEINSLLGGITPILFSAGALLVLTAPFCFSVMLFPRVYKVTLSVFYLRQKLREQGI
jgi:hypothetical protein